MFRVIGCITLAHDLRLVLVGLLVCLVASVATFNLFRLSLEQKEPLNLAIWLGLTTLSGSSGIWATHFIAMIGFQPAVAIGFDAISTVISFFVAVSLVGAAFALAVVTARPLWRVGSGIVLGLAIALMHYVGVDGLRVAGQVGWDVIPVLLSFLFALAFAVAAMLVAGEGRTWPRRLAASALFATSIATLHFTGMSALRIVPDPTVALPAGLLSGQRLGYGAAAITLLIVASTLAAWVIDHRAKREGELRMRFLARHDILTSLPNRLLLQELVEAEFAIAEADGGSVALLCLDLDGFKGVNDTFGHAAGDALLVEVAQRLRRLDDRCRPARLGGDEFAILATGLSAERTAKVVADTVLDALTECYVIDGNRVDVGCSVGVALFPTHGTNYAAIVPKADVALARAKADGRGVVRFFEVEMDEQMQRRRRLAADLRQAIAKKQLRVEYQPQLALDSNRTTGFEALLRWDHPIDGAISPAIFIPIAEETGLILSLGEWVLHEACLEAARWPAPLVVAVNVSAAQFRHSRLDRMIEAALESTSLPAHRLEIEVTESLFFADVPHTLSTLHRIRSLGVCIAMDDFGTGYSSLSTLQAFPFDSIKIDRSFTAQIGVAPNGTAIVKAVLGLGESLGIKVVAEGVETVEQVEFLRAHGCAGLQGFLYGRPRPIADYAQHILQERPNPDASNVVRLRSA